jgi:sulfur-oxidizing protein SoxY
MHASSTPPRRHARCTPLAVLAAGVLVLASLVAPVQAATLDEARQPISGAWDGLRETLYPDRRIDIASDAFMRIEAPANTPDPAATPVSIHFGAEALGQLQRVRVIIDNNPSPLAASIDIAADVPMTALDLRVRVDRYTSVRAIAETRDGRVLMRSGWIKASGGCSAAPAATEGGAPGEIRIRAADDALALVVGVRHPNHSGFQIDPRTGDTIPPFFIARIALVRDGKPLLSADTGISLSENPGLRIAFAEPLHGSVAVEAMDSTGARFSTTWRAEGAPTASR